MTCRVNFYNMDPTVFKKGFVNVRMESEPTPRRTVKKTDVENVHKRFRVLAKITFIIERGYPRSRVPDPFSTRHPHRKVDRLQV